MRSSHGIRIGLVMMGVLVFAAAQTAPQQPTVLAVGSAEISEVKGAVILHAPDGSALSAQRGVTLTADSTIETAKGSILLNLEDGSQVLVKGHSNVVLRAPDPSKGFSLELLIGKIVVKVKKRLGTNPSFKMGTPTAVITVRGTQFSVDVNKRRTSVQVFEGLVEVAGLAEGAPHVLIRPGFSTQIGIDQIPEQPRQINPYEGPDTSRENEGSRVPQTGREREDQQQTPQKQQPSQGTEKPD